VAGLGKDEAPFDDAAKEKFRGQAHDWLKAELAAWGKQLESDHRRIGRTLSGNSRLEARR